ncbi:hypothetical protein PFICI_05790 [Pestalotiopsis fici W106-1]|uniref:Heterokaryon incompatibility domain-containing protein n=1 Tax=Pestalotiopsis fici (strain W106-1 / CGMCC3.15140) TaxID=1229662 RepID=W3XD21_PESFW|nr:uncharacterized protein PFICI_05790 [Pestalotiopsis fici W106-1]ETS83914.1 hypothetical protein PFICI_05790 [Pestalotiopsis fici W106-1]
MQLDTVYHEPIAFASKNESDTFRLLSWGTESSRAITCNGISKVISHNLEVALRHLRPLVDWDSVSIWPEDHPLHSSRNAWRNFARNRSETRMNTHSQWKPVWIDSICINQDDPDERASQVKLMHEIYQKASVVKVFLGEEALGLGVPRLTDHGNVPVVLVFLEQALRNIEAQETSLASLRPVHDYAHRSKLHGLPKPTASEWDIFRGFLTNAWFQRTWVVQEIVLAKKAIVIQGDWHIDWDAIGKATAWYAREGYGMPQGIREAPADAPHLQPLADAANMWKMHQRPTKRLALLDILKDFRCRAATQAVDKLYATFGLAQETQSIEEKGIHALLEPDYTKSVKTVYRDLAKFLIIEYGSLIVLSHVNGYSADRSNWPSWVPDWSLTKPSSEIWRSRQQTLFRASGDEALTMDLSGDDDVLVLEGCRIDTVRIYGDKLKGSGFGFVPDKQERDFVSTAWRIMKSRESGTQVSQNSGMRDLLRSFIYTITIGLQGPNPWGEDTDEALADAAQWFSQYLGKSLPTVVTSSGKWFHGKKPDAGRFHQAFVHACKGRRFFTTEEGRVGVGPEFIKEGDSIVLLFGGQVPYIVRESEGKHRLIGECYIDGVMRGEVITGRNDGEWGQSKERFTLF